MAEVTAIDLYGGPGGWDIALKALGVDPLGIEIDSAACTTREAAGLRTLQADVSSLNPLDFTPCDLVIASAPCPTFSSAGNSGGRHLTAPIVRCLHELAAGNDTRAECREDAYKILAPIYWEREQEKARKKQREPDRGKSEARARRDADMSLLVVEPLRWVLALEPRFVALEQVPEVLPLWSEIASILGALGYSTWTGVMEAERYGVPQTRERAILMADREQPVHPPRPTHQRYVKGEPQRHEVTLEGEVLPWVSMAEALGRDGGTLETGQRSTISRTREDNTIPYTRESSEPAPVVMANADRWKFRNGNQANAAERELAEPAPTLHFGARSNKVDWVYDRPAPTIVTTRRSKDGILVGRQLPEGEGENIGGHNWPKERPSTAVCGDPRISPPGYRGKAEDYDADGTYNGERSTDKAIRVTLEEAAVLQSFPPDYPFQGTKSQRILQVGNAVPPLLAHAILSALLAPALEAALSEVTG